MIKKTNLLIYFLLLATIPHYLESLSAAVPHTTSHSLSEIVTKAIKSSFVPTFGDIGITYAGRHFYGDLAAGVTTNVQTLKNRQAVIKALQAEPELLKQIRKELCAINTSEQDIKIYAIDQSNAVLNKIMSNQRHPAILTILTSIAVIKRALLAYPDVLKHFKAATTLPPQSSTVSLYEHVNFYAEVDVFADIAHKMKYGEYYKTDMNGKNLTYCFAEFIENSEACIIEAVDLWGSAWGGRMTSQSIQLNSPATRCLFKRLLEDEFKHQFLRKTLPANLILAQTLGVAHAQSFKFTPFDQIFVMGTSYDSTHAFIAPPTNNKQETATLQQVKPTTGLNPWLLG